MAEVFGVVAGVLTVIELSAKVITKCKHLIETTRDAPKDLRHILVEVSSLKATLESFQYLSLTQDDFSNTLQATSEIDQSIKSCSDAVGELASELDGLSISQAAQVGPGKRQRLKSSLGWCLKESRARKLLETAMQHKSTITVALLGDVVRDMKDIKGSVKGIEKDLSDDNLWKICTWLERINPTQAHNDATNLREEHTCHWIIRHPGWQEWLAGNRRLFWIYGIPGAGKTILASYINTQVQSWCEQRSSKTCYLYFYFSYRHAQDQTTAFLRWMLSQLCRHVDHVPEEIIRLYHRNSDPSFSTLLEALKALLGSLDVAYVVVDAVDECNTRTDLLKLLTKLATDPAFAKLRFLATSRKYVDISDTFQPLAVPLSMLNPLVDEDISIYVNQELQRNPKLNRWPARLLNEITVSLVTGAKGMFRWAACQLYLLQKKRTESAIRVALKELPETLDETYARILLDIPKDDWPHAKKALMWICANDLLQSKGDIPNKHLLTAVFGNGKQQNCDYSFVQEICGCLVETSASDDSCNQRAGRTHFAHYSVKEFLVSIRLQNSNASYFSFSEQDAMYEYLGTAIKELDTPELSIGSPQQHSETILDSYDFYREGWEDSFFVYCCEARPQSQTHYLLGDDEELWRLLLKIVCHPVCILRNQATIPDTEPLGLALGRMQSGADSGTFLRAQQALVINSLSPFCADVYFDLDELRRRYEIDMESILSAPIQLRTREANVCTNLLELLQIYSHTINCSTRDSVEEYMAATFPSDTVLMLSVAAHIHFPDCCNSFESSHQADVGCVLHAPLADGADPNGPSFQVTPLQVAAIRWDYAGTKLLLEAGADPNYVGFPGGKDYPHIDNRHSSSSVLHIIRNSTLDVGLVQMLFMKEDRLGFIESRRKDGARIEQLLIQYGAKDFVASDKTAFRYPYRRSRDCEAGRW